MNTTTQFKSAERVIRDILKNDPVTRNSDFDLLCAVWKQSGVELTSFQINAIKKSFSPETIRRTRQKIQEKGEYLPTQTVLKGRQRLQEEHRAYHKPLNAIEEGFKAMAEEPKIVGYKEMEFNGVKRTFAVYS